MNNELTFTRKSGVPEVDKKIVEGTDKVETNEASIGDTINFEITGTLPENFADYKEYTYLFTDTLSKGLTYTQNSVVVEIVNGTGATATKTNVTKYFYTGATTDAISGETTLKVGISDLKALGNLTPAVTVDKNSKIVVTYSATLNENAVIADGGNENSVKLSYSNDPNNSGNGTTTPPPENPGEPTKPSGETPEAETVTYTTELTITKNDNKNQILTGAEFTLTGNSVNVTVITGDVYVVDNENGTYYKLNDGTYTTEAPTPDTADHYASVETRYKKETKVTVTGTGETSKSVSAFVNEEGKVTFSGLGVGEYTITETKTPAGYNTIAPISFKLTFNVDTKKFASDNENIEVGETTNTLATTIVNNPGSLLPSTGGIGTTIFYIAGVVLMASAGVLYIKKRRAGTKEQ